MMDIDSYLAKLQEDINAKVQKSSDDIGKRLDSILSSTSLPKDAAPAERASSPEGLPRLKVDERLEDLTKTKIGTFERTYQELYLKETGRPLSFGYSDLDYSQLINTLCCALEIELNASLCPLMKTFPEDLYRGLEDYPNNKWRDKQTLGTICMMVERSRKQLEHYLDDIDTFHNKLNNIRKARNPISHTSAIGKDGFLRFYDDFQTLFNNYIDALIRIKLNLSKTKAFGNYIIDEEYINSILRELGAENRSHGQSGRATKRGIIFTDTDRLAKKYYGNNRVVDDEGNFHSLSNSVKSVLREYVYKCREIGIEYSILDVSEPAYREYMEMAGGSWIAYHKVLTGYYESNHMDGADPQGLFIIGGNDVIPMAQVLNPSYSLFKRANRLEESEQSVDTDLIYAYDSSFFSLDPFDILLERMSQAKPRFYVGRLPLEDGNMATRFEDDIAGYLSRSLSAHLDGGIHLKTTPLLTACESSHNVALATVDGMPLYESPKIESYSNGRFIISPAYDLAQDVDERKHCTKLQQDADMLIFILHGSRNGGEPNYYGQGYERRNFMPMAFTPKLFDAAAARVIAAICCYGARFIGYQRSDSSLLKGIYGNLLLFMGASRSAYGNFDPQGEERDNPECFKATTAEIVLRYYCKLLLAGVSAGEALVMAKQIYIKRHSSNDFPCCIETTVLEFNLFGDPLLYLKPIADYDEELPEAIVSKEQASRLSREYTFTTVYDSQTDANGSSQSSLLDRIRGMVDGNLADIHNVISEKLYRKIGVEPRRLNLIKKYESTDGGKGYCAFYCDGSNPEYDYSVVVQMDDKYQIINKYYKL